jgi:hypothetical protein
MFVRISGPHAAAVIADAGVPEAVVLAAVEAALDGLPRADGVEALCLVPAFSDGDHRDGPGPRGISRKHAIAYVAVRLDRAGWEAARPEARIELFAACARAAVAASGLTGAPSEDLCA